MKKRIFWGVIIIIIIIIIIILLIHAISFGKKVYENYKEISRLGEFNLYEYEDFINYELIKEFTGDRTVKKITNSETAKQEAKKLWNEMYDEKYMKNKKIFEVSYDKEEDAWLVTGTLLKKLYATFLDGEIHAIIRTNGKVVAVWHD